MLINAHLPVITTPVGANLEFVCEDKTGFLAANATEWIDKISRLIGDPELTNQMAEAGSIQVKENDCHIIGQKLCPLIMSFNCKCVSSGESKGQVFSVFGSNDV